MVWPCLGVFWFGGDNPSGHGGGRKRKRQTEEGVGGGIKEWAGVGFAGSARAAEGRSGWGGLLRIHLWCPDDLPRLWDRIE